ncbi:hypothetical protein [Peribacillus tepidiphilus]|jgi:hypothetical protein|uniref:hypothetical protein n=1 Tax=Peribacillus tepidiphilus TaxID=2652445 RepID=UPI0035B5585B
MNFKNFLYLFAAIIFMILFMFLYKKSLGSIGFFVLAFISFYMAYKEWKLEQVKKEIHKD